MRFEQIPNPTGKGAPAFRVSALAYHPGSDRVAGVTVDHGRFFDASSGSLGARWREPSGVQRVVFRSDGVLVAVGMTLGLVSADGKRAKLGKALWKGYRAPQDCAAVGELLVAAHEGEDTPPTLSGVDLATGERRWRVKTDDLCAVAAHAGEVFCAAGRTVGVVDLESGAIRPRAELPWPVGDLWVDADGLWVTGGDPPAIARVDGGGRVVAQWTQPAGDGRTPERFEELTRVCGRLYALVHESLSGVEGYFDGYVACSLVSLPPALDRCDREPCTEAIAPWTQPWNPEPDALLPVGDTLWVGTTCGLVRGR